VHPSRATAGRLGVLDRQIVRVHAGELVQTVQDAARLRLVHPGQGEPEVDHHPVAGPRELATLIEQHRRRHPPLLTLDVDENALSYLVDSLEDLSRDAQAHGRSPSMFAAARPIIAPRARVSLAGR